MSHVDHNYNMLSYIIVDSQVIHYSTKYLTRLAIYSRLTKRNNFAGLAHYVPPDGKILIVTRSFKNKQKNKNNQKKRIPYAEIHYIYFL